jgi:hypothetical protein
MHFYIFFSHFTFFFLHFSCKNKYLLVECEKSRFITSVGRGVEARVIHQMFFAREQKTMEKCYSFVLLDMKFFALGRQQSCQPKA